MAQDKKIFNNLDIRENELKNAKVTNTYDNPITTDEVVVSSVAGTTYVDKSVIFKTTKEASVGVPKQLSEANISGIQIGDQVEGLTYSQLFDALVHPTINPTYTLPTGVFLLSGVSDFEVGASVTANLNMSVTNNDSQGSNGSTPYTFSGGSLTVTPQTSNSKSNSGYVMKEGSVLNTWNVSYSYLGSLTKNTNHGVAYPTGSFGSGTLTGTQSLPGVWPYFTSSKNTIPPPTSGGNLRNATNFTKTVAATPTTLAIVVSGDGNPKSITLAIPDTSNTSKVNVIKDGSINVTSSFTRSVIASVSDKTSSGQFKQYAVYYATNGVGYSVDSIYSFTITY